MSISIPFRREFLSARKEREVASVERNVCRKNTRKQNYCVFEELLDYRVDISIGILIERLIKKILFKCRLKLGRNIVLVVKRLY